MTYFTQEPTIRRMTISTRRPVAYLRRSSAANSNGGGRVSFDVQKAAVLDLGARNGDPDPELIVEWGASGAAAESAFGGTGRGGKRKAYKDLRASIDAGEVSALYAYSLSRLGRSTREILALFESCVNAGVPVHLSKEGTIDGTTPYGRMYLTIMAGVATMEAEVARERGKDRTASMRDRGAHIGRAPYGSVIGPSGTLVPDPATAPIVARVAELYADLGSPAKVAKALNEADVPAPTPEGGALARGKEGTGRWGDATVRRILARSGWTPATTRGSRALPSTMFGRLIRCACGTTLTPERSVRVLADGTAKEYRAYTCPAARFEPAHPKARRIAEPAILAFAQTEATRLRLPDRVEAAVTDLAARAELDGQRERVLDAYQSGAMPKDGMTRRIAALDAKVAALDAARTAVIDVPALDWSWDAPIVNGVLRTIWRHIQLDEYGQAVGAEWLLPEEYVAPRLAA